MRTSRTDWRPARRDGRAALETGQRGLSPGLTLLSAELLQASEDGRAAAQLLRAELLISSEVEVGGVANGAFVGDRGGPVFRWQTATGHWASCRPAVYLGPDGRAVIALDQLRVYGAGAQSIPAIAAALFSKVGSALLVGTPYGPLVAGLTPAEPLAMALSHTGAGQVSAEGCSVVAAVIRPEGLRIVVARNSRANLPPLPDRYTRFTEIDGLILAGNTAGATQRCLGALRDELLRSGAIDRLCWCVAGQPSAFPDPVALIQRFLLEAPDLPWPLLALAAAYADRGEAAEAVLRLEQLAEGPQSLPAERALAWLAAAELLSAQGDSSRAAALFCEAWRADGSHRLVLERLAALPESAFTGLALTPLGVAGLTGSPSEAPQAAAYHLQLGRRFLAVGAPSAARRHLERALALAPRDSGVQESLLEALQLGGWEGAANRVAESLGRELGSVPSVPTVAGSAEEGQLAIVDALSGLPLSGFFSGAEEASQTSVAYVMDPVEGDALLEEALGLFSQDGEESDKRLEAILDDPRNRRALLDRVEEREELAALMLLATLRQRSDDPFGAEDAFERVLALDAECAEALQRLRVLYRRRDNWSGFIDVVTKQAGLAQDRRDWAAELVTVARVRFERMGQVKQALVTAAAVLKTCPDDIETLVLNVELHEAAGEPARALECAGALLESEDLDPGLRLALLERAGGLCLHDPSKSQAAIAYWQELLRLAPDHLIAMEALQAHFRLEQDAVAELEMVEKRLEHSEAFDTEGAGAMLASELLSRRAAIRLGQGLAPEEVRGDLEQALRAWAENADALEHYVTVLRRQGDTAALKDALAKLTSMMLAGPEREALEAELKSLALSPS